MRGLGFGALALAATLVCTSVALAQVPPARPPGVPPGPAEKAAAARRFKEGERFFTMHDYRSAAQAFEEAYGIAPHPDVLFNAVDARERAGELAYAASLCERVTKDFPTDAVRSEASEHLSKYIPKLGRLDLMAGAGVSDVAIDGRPVALGITYVDPGDHVVTAAVGAQRFQRRVQMVAGARETVKIELVPAQPVTPAKKDDDDKPLHPAFFFVGAGITTASAALLVWSGIDTNEARSEYDAAPTRAGLDDGRAKQVRTNVFLGTTIGFGVLTAAIGIFATDWLWVFGTEDPKPRPQQPGAAVRVSASPTWASVELAF